MKYHLFALLFLAGTCVADDIEDALKRSSFAGIVTITAGDQMPYKSSELTNCGSSYIAYANAERVYVNNIGWVEGYPIEFRAASTLELGGTYLVFLNESASEESDALFMERELRTERCMSGGISLVPVLVDTQTVGFGAVFQEWRKVEDANYIDGIDYQTYILAISEFKSFFRQANTASSDSLESSQLEIFTSHGPLHRDAYLSDEVMELTATISCDLRKPVSKPTNDLMIASCE